MSGRSTLKGCTEISQGLSEHSERYPWSTLTASFLARLRRAGIQWTFLTGGCALRAYPRLISQHRSAVPNLAAFPLYLTFFFLAPIAVQQGQAVRLTMPDAPGIQSVEVRWQDKTIPYVRAGMEWSTVVGIDLDLKPGDHTGEVRITKAGGVETRSLTLSVTAGKFPTQRLTVPDAYVELSPENGERAAREAKEIEEIHNTISAEALWSSAFIVPIPGGVGSNFGNRRVFNGESRNPHSGADLRATTGTRIRSTNRGRVVLAKNLFFTGNTVIVDHGLGIYTLYAHLSRIDVKQNAIVERAQVVGLAGATGRVTGPHLHWGARVQNARVDPFSLITIKTGK